MATTIASIFIKGKNSIRKIKVYIANEIPRLNSTAKIVVMVNTIEPVYAQIQKVIKIKPRSTKVESDINSRSNNVLFRPSCMP